MSELLPCPFCGGTDTKTYLNAVECKTCDAAGPDTGAQQGSPVSEYSARAIAAWNRRATPPGPADGGEAVLAKVRAADEAIGGKMLADIRHGTDVETAKRVVNLKAAAQSLAATFEATAAVLAALRPAALLTEDWRDRFWQIVDSNGLLGLPSDEWNALRRLVDSYAALSRGQPAAEPAAAKPESGG